MGLGGGTLEKSKFKTSDDFRKLQECITLFKQNLPYLNRNFPDATGYSKLKQFWDNITALAEAQHVDVKKDHIGLLHFAKHSEPLKKILPSSMVGYDIEIAKAAQNLQMHETLPVLEKGVLATSKLERANASHNDLKEAAGTFLTSLDGQTQKITDVIQPHIRNGFSAGIEKLRTDVEEVLNPCNEVWVKYESAYFGHLFKSLTEAIATEARLGESEAKKNLSEIAELENQFMAQCADLIEEFSDAQGIKDMKDTIALAEASILMNHEKEWTNCAQRVLKQVLRLRICLVKIQNAESELKNEDPHMLQKFLTELSESVQDAQESLECAASLPRPRDHGRITNQW